MSDPIPASEKEKLLESLVSPIKEKERRYSDLGLNNDELSSIASIATGSSL